MIGGAWWPRTSWNVLGQLLAAIDRPLSPISSPRQSLTLFFTILRAAKQYPEVSAHAPGRMLRNSQALNTLSAFYRIDPAKLTRSIDRYTHMSNRQVLQIDLCHQYEIEALDLRNILFGGSPMWNLGAWSWVLVILAPPNMQLL